MRCPACGTVNPIDVRCCSTCKRWVDGTPRPVEAEQGGRKWPDDFRNFGTNVKPKKQR